MEVLAVCLVIAWFVRVAVEDGIAAVRGTESPRITRQRARLEMARAAGVPTIGQAAAARIAIAIAPSPGGPRRHPALEYVRARWEDAWDELLESHNAEMRRRAQERRDRQAREAEQRRREHERSGQPHDDVVDAEVVDPPTCSTCHIAEVNTAGDQCPACRWGGPGRTPQPPPDVDHVRQRYRGEWGYPCAGGCGAAIVDQPSQFCPDCARTDADASSSGGVCEHCKVRDAEPGRYLCSDCAHRHAVAAGVEPETPRDPADPVTHPPLDPRIPAITDCCPRCNVPMQVGPTEADRRPSFDEGDGGGMVGTYCPRCGIQSYFGWAMSDEDFEDEFGYPFGERPDDDEDNENDELDERAATHPETPEPAPGPDSTTQHSTDSGAAAPEEGNPDMTTVINGDVHDPFRARDHVTSCDAFVSSIGEQAEMAANNLAALGLGANAVGEIRGMQDEAAGFHAAAENGAAVFTEHQRAADAIRENDDIAHTVDGTYFDGANA